jgi:thiamine-phosphate pyrophosphorylase
MYRDRPIVCLVTDRRRLMASDDDFESGLTRLVNLALEAVHAGVDIIQVRERDLEAARLADLVAAIVETAHGSATSVVVNDRMDVALACGAAGVHLRADSFSPAAARSIAPPGFLVGRSVHDLDEAIEYAPVVDYLLAGTVFPTPSKPDAARLLGVSGLKEIATTVSAPVLAIGGVTMHNLPQLAASGAAGVAAIGLFLSGKSMATVVDAVRAEFDRLETAS